jgi:hypothetical protein
MWLPDSQERLAPLDAEIKQPALRILSVAKASGTEFLDRTSD